MKIKQKHGGHKVSKKIKDLERYTWFLTLKIDFESQILVPFKDPSLQ